MQIDHNPYERQLGNGIYWVAFGIIALLWVGYLSLLTVDWPSVCLGGATTALIVMWGIETTGNRTPDSWRKAAEPRAMRKFAMTLWALLMAGFIFFPILWMLGLVH